MGQDDVLFFPSSYRRAVKYGQRDAASEILRTEVLSRLSRRKTEKNSSLYIVSCPEAVSELVVSKKRLDERTLTLSAGQTVDLVGVQRTLRDFGFPRSIMFTNRDSSRCAAASWTYILSVRNGLSVSIFRQ